MDNAYTDKVKAHWFTGQPGDLLQRIDAGLAKLNKSRDKLVIDDLLAVDEFHIRGREATAELAALAQFTPGAHIVDVGAGLGGPSRYLASTVGCRVQGIDLTPEYCAVATQLARSVGLGDKVAYDQANALNLPFLDDQFDGGWTQHISMNIENKAQMFGELRRVVKSGGTVAIYDPIAGSGEALTFPVPWASDASMSHLLTTDATRALLEEVGFQIAHWHDVTDRAIAWFAENAARGSAPPPLGLHLLLGEQWPVMAKNMVENLRTGRLNVVQIVCKA